MPGPLTFVRRVSHSYLGCSFLFETRFCSHVSAPPLTILNLQRPRHEHCHYTLRDFTLPYCRRRAQRCPAVVFQLFCHARPVSTRVSLQTAVPEDFHPCRIVRGNTPSSDYSTHVFKSATPAGVPIGVVNKLVFDTILLQVGHFGIYARTSWGVCRAGRVRVLLLPIFTFLVFIV